MQAVSAEETEAGRGEGSLVVDDQGVTMAGEALAEGAVGGLVALPEGDVVAAQGGTEAVVMGEQR